MKEFVEEFRIFKSTANEVKAVEKEENLITLFAIFRKDTRTEKIQPKNNNNGDQPATEKQKKYIKGLFKKQGRGEQEFGIDYDKLTKGEASGLIEQLRSD